MCHAERGSILEASANIRTLTWNYRVINIHHQPHTNVCLTVYTSMIVIIHQNEIDQFYLFIHEHDYYAMISVNVSHFITYVYICNV